MRMEPRRLPLAARIRPPGAPASLRASGLRIFWAASRSRISSGLRSQSPQGCGRSDRQRVSPLFPARSGSSASTQSPEGTAACSLGREPQEPAPTPIRSPSGAAQPTLRGRLPSTLANAAAPGLLSPLRGWIPSRILYLGLAPQATSYRPFGASEHGGGSPGDQLLDLRS